MPFKILQYEALKFCSQEDSLPIFFVIRRTGYIWLNSVNFCWISSKFLSAADICSISKRVGIFKAVFQALTAALISHWSNFKLSNSIFSPVLVKRPDVLGVLHILQIQAPHFCVPHPLVSSTPLLMAAVTDSSPGRRPDFDSSNDRREDASSRISPSRQICPPSLNHFPHNPPTYFPLSGCQPLNGSSVSISAPRALTSYGFVSVEDDRLREKQRQLIPTKITT